MESTVTSRKYFGFSGNYLGFVVARTRKLEIPVKVDSFEAEKSARNAKTEEVGTWNFAQLQEREDKVIEQQWQISELIWII